MINLSSLIGQNLLCTLDLQQYHFQYIVFIIDQYSCFVLLSSTNDSYQYVGYKIFDNTIWINGEFCYYEVLC